MLKGYADHHVVFAIVQALCTRGMDVMTAADRGQQEADDAELLADALVNQRVMLTNDTDLLALAAEHARRGEVFAPIFFWPQQQRGIGEIVRKIIREATLHSYKEACSRVFFQGASGRRVKEGPGGASDKDPLRDPAAPERTGSRGGAGGAPPAAALHIRR